MVLRTADLRISKAPYSLYLLLMVLSSCSTSEDIELADPDIAWSFVVFSDVQQGYGVYRQLAQNIAKIQPPPAMAVCCGDLMLRSANESEWLSFKRCSKPVTDCTTLLLARGNHEGNDAGSEEILREMWSFPSGYFYYSTKTEDALFIILDTQVRNEEGGIMNDK